MKSSVSKFIYGRDRKPVVDIFDFLDIALCLLKKTMKLPIFLLFHEMTVQKAVLAPRTTENSIFFTLHIFFRSISPFSESSVAACEPLNEQTNGLLLSSLAFPVIRRHQKKPEQSPNHHRSPFWPQKLIPTHKNSSTEPYSVAITKFIHSCTRCGIRPMKHLYSKSVTVSMLNGIRSPQPQSITYEKSRRHTLMIAIQA